MESVKIDQLLESYFEGTTSLAEEAALKTYFSGTTIAPHLEQYAPLFTGLKLAKEEVSTINLMIPHKSLGIRSVWWYRIAASAVVIIAVAGFLFSESNIAQQEQEALAAFNESKKTMLLLSENFNKGTEQLSLVGEFVNTKNRILK